MDITLFDIIAKHGISVATVGSGIYLLFYLVKHTVCEMSKVIERQNDRMKELSHYMKDFTGHVRREHGEHSAEHKDFLVQHQEIMKGLERINGYK